MHKIKRETQYRQIVALVLATIILAISCTMLGGAQDDTESVPISSNNETPHLPITTTATPGRDIKQIALNQLTAETNHVVIDSNHIGNSDSIKYVVKDLCSTKKYCRIFFFATDELTQRVAVYLETSISKLFPLSIFDVNGELLGLEKFNINDNFEPIGYRVAKVVVRDYYFVAISQSDIEFLKPTVYNDLGADLKSFGSTLCKSNNDYCYVFIWDADGKTLLPGNTMMSAEQIEALKLVYIIENGEEDTQICQGDECLHYSSEPEAAVHYNLNWSNP